MDENKLINFLKLHWSKFFLGLLAVGCIGVWGERFWKAGHTKSNQDYLTAGQIFGRFLNGESLAVESVETAEKILKRHPELHPKYDAMLAIHYFSQANTEAGLKYAKSTLSHVSSFIPSLYKDFASTSLLINEGKYAQAFESALSLQEKLKDQHDGQVLEAMNILRLVVLADKLGDKERKTLYLAQLQIHPAYPSIASVFQEGSLSLSDYLNKI